MAELDVLVRTMPTPNPNAIKFITNHPIKRTGKATFEDPSETRGVRLADELFAVNGVLQLHMFENVVTVTHAESADIQKLKEEVSSVLRTRLAVHDPDFVLEEEKQRDLSALPPDIRRIEEILDETIRPALRADGGDLEVISYKDHILEVKYQGACGSCPSSLFGTLQAITGILQDEFDPELEIVVPDMEEIMGANPYSSYY